MSLQSQPVGVESRSAKLTVIFYIFLCLEAGAFLTILPWWGPSLFGLTDWGDNYFLLYASRKIGLEGLHYAVASGWVRGAVTGVGLLNFVMAFWEITHFKQTVRALQGSTNATPVASAVAPASTQNNAASQTPDTDDLSHHARRDDAGNTPGL